MEALYTKLYDRYCKLKKEKFSEVDHENKAQEEKFVTSLTAADELIKHLNNENSRLREQNSDLRSEMFALSSTLNEKCVEYQKLLMEENRKNKVLSDELECLRKLQKEGVFHSSEDAENDGQSNTFSQATTPKMSEKSSKKRSRLTEAETEENMIRPGDDRDSVLDQLPKCCRRPNFLSGVDIDDGCGSNCLFQVLIEYLVGMKLSVSGAAGICVSVSHQSSGYSFSLTWIDKEVGEWELLYRVLSLGTFARVAPEWMKEDIMFSMSMCTVFFERVARVIKLHC